MSTTTPTLLPAASIKRKLQYLLNDFQSLLCLREPDAGQVHRLRRDVKKLRAWLQLLHDQEGHRVLRRSDRILRDTARHVRSLRDAQVYPQTLQWLGAKGRTDAETAACRQLLQTLVTDCSTSGAGSEGLPLEPLLPVLHLLRDTRSAGKNPKALRRSLGKSCRNVRKQLEKHFDEDDAEQLHRLRKIVKRLALQLELVLSHRKRPARRLQQDLDTLADELGRYHDLMMLQQRLGWGPATGESASREQILFEALLQREAETLRATSLELAGKLVSDSALLALRKLV